MPVERLPQQRIGREIGRIGILDEPLDPGGVRRPAVAKINEQLCKRRRRNIVERGSFPGLDRGL